jgi:Fur family ferric uptake transcriptional regulator
MSAQLDARARSMLKQAKLYRTEARTAILLVLLKAVRPLRQDQIAQRLTTKTRNKVTVYRTLESLTAAGLVHKAFMQGRAWHFELADHCTDQQCHPHFTCTSCGVTHCLTDISMPMAKVAHRGFLIHRQQVCLEGLCPACR